MAKRRAAGIDLGTTFSVAAWVDQTGRTALISSSEGDVLKPSVVLFEEDAVVVGKAAKKAGVLKPGSLAECVKRDMGSPVYSRAIDGVYLPPEVIQACVLNELKTNIIRAAGPGAAVVITVPAFFNEPRRRATAVAGEIAGLDLLDIVNEPTAAALAFGESLGILGPGGSHQGRMNILVYDLGGGTFDVTLLEIDQRDFHTIATDGDVKLGGRDWDMRLVDLVSQEFIDEFREDPRQNPASLQCLLTEVEHAKHTLSARQRATIRVEHAGSSREVEVTREAFEEATADLLERTRLTTQELLATGRVAWKEVSRVLLVGGATRMPMVPRMIEALSGIGPDHTVSPDEAVARGAAIYAKYLLDSADSGTPRPTFTVANVNSHSLGVEGIEPDTLEKVNTILIPRNTPLPAKKTKTFVTKVRNQPSIKIQVLEGESSIPSECTAIGCAVIDDLPEDLPAGHPVEVTFEYGTNGRLKVHAEVPGTDREVALEIERAEALSDRRIPQWKDVVCGKSGFAAFKAMAEQDMQSASSADTWTTQTSSAAADRTALGPDEQAPEKADTVLKRRKRRRRSVVSELTGIILGGLLGLALGQLILWWICGVDPLNIGPDLPNPVKQWVVPAKFQ